MKLTRYGRREWLGLGMLALALLLACVLAGIFLGDILPAIYLSALVVGAWICIAAFFRDPERAIPADPDAIVSPADGVVKDIELIRSGHECEEFSEFFKGRDMVRIGIFLSVFDVHLNRAPCDMKVEFKLYKEGAFHDARDQKASKENESMALGGTGRIGEFSFPVLIRQISGAIARRIVCEPEIGDGLAKGSRYGMIKFGSRTELFLPAGKGFELCAKVGDRVFGASSVIARRSMEEPKEMADTAQVPLQEKS